MPKNTDGASIEVSVQVHPRSGKVALMFVDDVLHIWVSARPIEGAANDAVIALLAKTFGVTRRDVTLVRGATAHHKRIMLHGVTTEQLHAVIDTATS